MIVAVSCTLVATPILWLMYDGITGHSGDGVVGNLLPITHSLVLAVLLANMLLSLADKMISGFVALAVAESVVGWAERSGTTLPDTEGVSPVPAEK